MPINEWFQEQGSLGHSDFAAALEAFGGTPFNFPEGKTISWSSPALSNGTISNGMILILLVMLLSGTPHISPRAFEYF